LKSLQMQNGMLLLGPAYTLNVMRCAGRKGLPLTHMPSWVQGFFETQCRDAARNPIAKQGGLNCRSFLSIRYSDNIQ
jgi:hypothetical protein